MVRPIASALGALALGACVQGQVAHDYLKGNDAQPVPKAQSAAPASLAKVEVEPFATSNFRASPMLLPYVVDTVKTEDFKGILEKRLADSGVFDSSAPEALTLTAEMREWRDKSPSAFPPSIYDVDVNYKLKTAEGDVVFDRTLTATGRDSTFFGSTRLELANAKAFIASADALIAALEADLKPTLAARTQRLAAKAEAEEKLVKELKPRNAPYIVATDGATVREFPSPEAPKLGTLKLDTPVTVIGELPDGWLRISGTTYASAWIFGTALKPAPVGPVAAAPGAPTPAAGGAAAGYVIEDKPANYVAVADTQAMAAPARTASMRDRLPRGTKVDAAVRSTNGYVLARKQGVFVGWVSLSELAPTEAPAKP